MHIFVCIYLYASFCMHISVCIFVCVFLCVFLYHVPVRLILPWDGEITQPWPYFIDDISNFRKTQEQSPPDSKFWQQVPNSSLTTRCDHSDCFWIEYWAKYWVLANFNFPFLLSLKFSRCRSITITDTDTFAGMVLLIQWSFWIESCLEQKVIWIA